MVTESPPVSPKVVAAILMIQNTSVTWGTLLKVVLAKWFMFSIFFVVERVNIHSGLWQRRGGNMKGW